MIQINSKYVMVGRTYSRRRRARDVRRDVERTERVGGAHEDARGAITASGWDGN
jgi:hypothetical protein